MLELRGVRKTFHPGTVNARVALDGIDLTLREGDFAVIIGGNGAGKSTLLNVVAGEVMADQGSIVVAGRDVTRLPTHRRAGLVSRVFQDPLAGTAGSMTIEENMALAARRGQPVRLRAALTEPRRARARALLAPFGLGLESRLGDRVALLSGGQRQSLALAMAVVTLPKLILLDEHTAALDPRTGAAVMAATVAAVREHRLTALMVTHNMRDAIAHGNRLIMMMAGRIVLDAHGAEKEALTVEALVERFHLSDDKMLLA